MVKTTSTFIGRQKELNELYKSLNKAGMKEGSIVLVSGEEGIGKTELINQFQASIDSTTREKIIFARTSGSGVTGSFTAFHPFYELFDEIFCDDEKKHIQGPYWDILVKYIPRIVDYISPETYKVTKGIISFAMIIRSGWKKEYGKENVQEMIDFNQGRFFLDFTNALLDASEVCPLVLIIDHLQWIDESSANLLHLISERIGDHHILIIGAYHTEEIVQPRDGKPYPFGEVLPKLKNVTGIELGFLEPDEVSAYISNVCPNHKFPTEFLGLIFDKSEGNPLFMVEFIKLLKDDQVIIQEKEVWKLKGKIEDIRLRTPNDVKRIIEARVDSIKDPKDMKLHKRASVEGEKFTSDILSKLMSMDEGDLLDELEPIMEKYALIIEVSEESMEEADFEFKYSLAHQNIYGKLSRTNRVRLHKKIGKLLEVYYRSGLKSVDVSTLAFHFEHGSEFKKAVKYYQIKIDESLQSKSFVEALSNYKKVDSIMEENNIGTPEMRLEILLDMARIHQILGHGEAALETLNKSLDLNKDVGDELIEAANLTNLGITSFYLGEFAQSIEVLERAQTIYESHDFNKLSKDHQKTFGICINWLGINYRNHKELKKSLKFHKRAEDIAEKIDFPRLLAHAKANLGAVELWKKNYDEVIKYWEESKTISEDADDTPWIAHYTIDVGYMHLLNRNFPEAEDALVDGIKIARDNYFEENVARGIMNKGSLYFVQEKMDKAMKEYEEAFDIAEKQKISKLMWRIHHNMGNIYRSKKDYKNAHEYYMSSVNYLEEMLSNVESDKKKGFLEHRLDPFRSLILLSRERKNEDEALKYAKTLGLDLLTDYYEELKQGLDLKVEEEKKGNLNFFDGYYVVTE